MQDFLKLAEQTIKLPFNIMLSPHSEKSSCSISRLCKSKIFYSRKKQKIVNPLRIREDDSEGEEEESSRKYALTHLTFPATYYIYRAAPTQRYHWTTRSADL